MFIKKRLLAVSLTATLACAVVASTAGTASAQDSADAAYGKVLGEHQKQPSSSASPSTGIKIGRPSKEKLESYDTWFSDNKDRHLKELQDLGPFANVMRRVLCLAGELDSRDPPV